MSPGELLEAWRATERSYARSVPGSQEAAELHAEMRRLMDEYEWVVRGSVGRRREEPVTGRFGRPG